MSHFFKSKKIFVLLVCVLLMGASLACFYQSTNFDYIGYDDDKYVSENLHVKNGLSWDGVKWAFTSHHMSNWHPLTWVSHMGVCHFFGSEPRPQHAINLIIHTINILLLFFIFFQMTGALWRSAFIAAIFAIHPMHIESIVWIAELKDLLSTCFCFLAILTYIRYRKADAVKWYIFSIVLFIFGLLAKPMIVTLPLILVLLDFWPLKQITSRYSFLKSIKGKIPFIVFALISCGTAIWAQSTGGATANLKNIPIDMRLANMSISYVIYIAKFFWPVNLAIFHPYVEYSTVSFLSISSYLILLSLIIVSLKLHKKYPFLVVGFFWYLITLIPVIGLVQVGAQQYAERYTYVPYIGLSIIVVWVAAIFVERFHIKKIWIWILATLIIFLLMMQTCNNIKFWKNGVTLYEHALKVTNNNYLVHLNLGHAYLEKGDLAATKKNIEKSVKIKSNIWNTYDALGIIATQEGKYEEAFKHFRQAIKLKPDNGSIYFNVGVLYQKLNQNEKAEEHYLKSIELDPSLVAPHNRLALLYFKRCDIENSKKHAEIILQLDPNNVDAKKLLYNLAPFEGKTEVEQERLCHAIKSAALVKKISKISKIQKSIRKIPKVRKLI